MNRLLALLLLPACKVVDAPDTLEAMMVFGFRNTTAPDEIQAVADELPAMVQRHIAEVEEGYRVDSLGRNDIDAAGPDPGVMDKPIVGAMGRMTYRHDIDDVADAISSKHRDQIAENTTSFVVTDETDRACFLAGDCPTYHQEAEQVTKVAVIGDLTQTFTQDFIWVTHEERPAIASRVVAPHPVDVSSGLVAIDQQYTFFLIRQLPKGGCERVESMWAEARFIGADLPDTFMIDAWVNETDEQAAKVDAWLDSQGR